MGDMSSMNRESKKNQLRRRLITTNTPWIPSAQEDSEEIVRRAERKVRRRHLILFLTIVILMAAAACAYNWYLRSYQYQGISVGWERRFEQDEIGFVDYEPFGENLLRYSKDGASCLDSSGKDIWIQPYEMHVPIVAVNGDYAAIGDQQGNHIYIFDKTGLLGTATTILPIIKLTISSKGLAAVIVEGQSTSHIYYYAKDGSELDISITGFLNGEIGYPLDISLSPDGSMLMGSFTYLQGGEVKNRVAFYNFSEVGKNAPNRFVGGFHEMYGASMIPRVHYLDSVYSVAFADSSLSFYSSLDVMSPELLKQIPVEEEIKTVFYSSKYAGVVVKAAGEYDYRLDLYTSKGDLVFREGFSFDYKHIDIDGDSIFLYNENSCRIYNRFGNLKYEGTFDFPVSRLCNGRLPNQIIAAGAQAVKEIKLH